MNLERVRLRRERQNSQATRSGLVTLGCQRIVLRPWVCVRHHPMASQER